MCGKVPESLAHVLVGCSSLAQTKYIDRHDAALKLLFFEMLRDLKLADSVPPWYSRVEPKPLFESEYAQAYRDVPGSTGMFRFTWNALLFEPTVWMRDVLTTRR